MRLVAPVPLVVVLAVLLIGPAAFAADEPAAQPPPDCSPDGLATIYVLGPSDQLVTVHSDPAGEAKTDRFGMGSEMRSMFKALVP